MMQSFDKLFRGNYLEGGWAERHFESPIPLLDMVVSLLVERLA